MLSDLRRPRAMARLSSLVLVYIVTINLLFVLSLLREGRDHFASLPSLFAACCIFLCLCCSGSTRLRSTLFGTLTPDIAISHRGVCAGGGTQGRQERISLQTLRTAIGMHGGIFITTTITGGHSKKYLRYTQTPTSYIFTSFY